MCYTTYKCIEKILKCGEILTKTVLITGASGGIGRSCVLAFAKLGYNIVLHYYTNSESVFTLQREISDKFNCFSIAVGADLSSPSEVSDMFDIIEKHFGGIDILINNAGIAQIKMFSDITDADWDKMFNVNVKSVFNCCREALPYMIDKKLGKIINISSIWGISGASCEVHYSASKAAVIGFTKALAKEVAPSGIQVNCIAPGVIDTPMNGCLTAEALDNIKEETPLGCIGSPEDIASCAVFLASAGGDFITGQVISPNGGMVI